MRRNKDPVKAARKGKIGRLPGQKTIRDFLDQNKFSGPPSGSGSDPCGTYAGPSSTPRTSTSVTQVTVEASSAPSPSPRARSRSQHSSRPLSPSTRPASAEPSMKVKVETEVTDKDRRHGDKGSGGNSSHHSHIGLLQEPYKEALVPSALSLIGASRRTTPPS